MRLGEEFSRLYARDLLRLRQEVEAFPSETQLWEMTPGMTNAPGTLVLHIEGNLREYIGRHLGGVAFVRNRSTEFSTGGLSKEDLQSRTSALLGLIPGVLLDVPESEWEQLYPEEVLGHPISNRMFVLHLLGHLNYHLGQLDCQRRALCSTGAIGLANL